MKVKIRGDHAGRILAGILVFVLLSVSGGATAAPAPATNSSLFIADNASSLVVTPLYDNPKSAWNPLLFSQLTQINNQGIVVPQLLASLPSTANGGIRAHGTQLLLTLRSHRSWSNGAEITASGVVFGWRVARVASHGQYCAATGCRTIRSVRRQDRYHVLITLRHPYSPLLTDGLPPVLLHSWPAFAGDPHRAAAIIDRATYYYGITYPTSGPYKLVFQEAVVSQRHRTGATPFFQRIVIRSYSHLNNVLQAPNDQQPDVVEDQNGFDLAALLHNHGLYHLDFAPTFYVANLQLNAGDRKYLGHPNPMHDLRVRQALALATDRRALASELLGVPRSVAGTLVAYTPFVESARVREIGMRAGLAGAWDPLARRYVPYGPRALRDARQLLSNAGYHAGLHVDVLQSVYFQASTFHFDALTKGWAAIGVRLRLVPNTSYLMCGDLGPHTGRFEAFLAPVITGPDPDVLRAALTSSKASRVAQEGVQCHPVNVSGTQDHVLDRYLKQGAETYSLPARRKLYAQAERRVAQRAYWIPLFYYPHIVLFKPGITGVQAYPQSPAGRFVNYAWNVGQWHRLP